MSARSAVDLLSLHRAQALRSQGHRRAVCRRATAARQLQPLLFGGGQERGLRSGTLRGASDRRLRRWPASWRASELPAEAARIEALRQRLWRGLAAIDGVLLNGHPERRVPGILNVSFRGRRRREPAARPCRAGALDRLGLQFGQRRALARAARARVASRAGAELAALQPGPLQQRAARSMWRSRPCGARCSGCGRWRRDASPDPLSPRDPRRCSSALAHAGDLRGVAAVAGTIAVRRGRARGAGTRVRFTAGDLGRPIECGALPRLWLSLHAGGLRVAGAPPRGARGPRRQG